MTPAMQELLLYLVVVASVAGLACAYLRKDDQGDQGDQGDQQGSGEAEADFDPLASFRGSIEEDVAAQRRAAAARLGKGALRDGHEL